VIVIVDVAPDVLTVKALIYTTEKKITHRESKDSLPARDRAGSLPVVPIVGKILESISKVCQQTMRCPLVR
jgi:hypothetical protein